MEDPMADLPIEEAAVLLERIRTLLRAHAGTGDIVAHEQVGSAIDRLEGVGGSRRLRDDLERLREVIEPVLGAEHAADPDGVTDDEDRRVGPAGEPASLDVALQQVDQLERTIREG
jgi:hypothetical protein